MFEKQKKKIISTLSGAKEAAGNYKNVIGLKGRQNKMIKSFVEKSRTGLNIPTEKRTSKAVATAQEEKSEKIKDILRKKGIYK